MSNNEASTSYVVTYYSGYFDDQFSVVVFVTSNKSTAIAYVEKFNRALKKWKKYYEECIKEKGYNRQKMATA
jgi:L-rhamnose mutarotase